MASHDTPLVDLFFSHNGKTVDKWEHYLVIYAHELAPLLHTRRPLRLLEIGVQNGGSLELWEQYLPEGSQIVGIDVDPNTAGLTFTGAIRVHIADVTDPTAVAAALGDAVFDIIIDDGSHRSADIIATFRILFERLALGGKFIIEDLHASYWPSFGGGLRTQSSAIDFFKGLVDALNVDHLQQAAPHEIVAELQEFAPHLARIAFYDSVVIVDKLTHGKTAPYRRVLSGIGHDVVDPFDGIIALPVVQMESLLLGPRQKQHIEAKLVEQLQVLKAADARRNGELERVSAEGAELRAALNDLQLESEAALAKLRAEKDAELLENLGRANAELEAERQHQQAEIGRLTMQVRNAEALAQDAEARVRLVYASSSWRVTSPLRIGSRLLRRVFGVAIGQSGGGHHQPAAPLSADGKATALGSGAGAPNCAPSPRP